MKNTTVPIHMDLNINNKSDFYTLNVLKIIELISF